MPAKNKRSLGQSSRQAREHAASDEPVLETNADVAMEQHADVDLCIVPDTRELFDVAGFGTLNVMTTRLCGGLIGRSLWLANSTWPGYSGGSAECMIDGVVLAARGAVKQADMRRHILRVYGLRLSAGVCAVLCRCLDFGPGGSVGSGGSGGRVLSLKCERPWPRSARPNLVENSVCKRKRVNSTM